jgi:ATP-dependent protease ClpP protease subunit
VQAKYLAASTGKEEEQIMLDFSRPRYFSAFEAAEYGLIDQVGGVCRQEQNCL